MNKQIKWGAILQYVQMALSILIGIIYTPIMLRMLGQSEYGLYNISSSIISYLSLLSLGFGASYVRFYTIRKKEDVNRLKYLNGLYLFVFSLIGLIAIVAGFIIAFNVNIFLNDSYSVNDINIAKWLMILLAFNLGISFPASLFVSYITAQEKFIFLKLINIGKTVLAPALSIIALFFGYGSIGLVVITTTISLIIDAINVLYCLKKLNMKFSLKKIEFGLLKDIFIFSIFIAINNIIDQVNWQTDKVILGKMITSAAVSIYAIGASLNTYFIQFSTAISSLFIPKINQIVVDNKDDCNEQLTKLMTAIGRIQFFILSLVLIGFVFFGKYFINKWAGPEYGDSYYVALLLMSPEIVPLIQNIGIEIQRAKNMHQFRSIAYLIMAFINVGISIPLCYFYGPIGVAFGTTISIIVANILVMNVYYHKKIKINMFYFWKEIFKILPAFIPPICVGLLYHYFLSTYTVYDYVRQIIVFILIYSISILTIGINRQERSQLAKFFKLLRG